MKIYDEYENLHLDKMNFHVARALSLKDIDMYNMDFKTRVLEESKILMLELHATFLSKPVVSKVMTTEVPENWLEAVKERFLPRFARKYWPIKHVQIMTEIRTYNVCPHIHLPDNRSQHLRWLATNDLPS